MDAVVRIVVAGLFAALLFRHARSLAARPNQRRAYQLAAVAMLLAAVYNAVVAAGADDQLRQSAVGVAVVVVFVAAAIFFVRGYFAGEMRADHERASEMGRAFRERRERELEAARRKPGDKDQPGA